jgi:hypothetical protein
MIPGGKVIFNFDTLTLLRVGREAVEPFGGLPQQNRNQRFQNSGPNHHDSSVHAETRKGRIVCIMRALPGSILGIAEEHTRTVLPFLAKRLAESFRKVSPKK